jgi:hypothetical protein
VTDVDLSGSPADLPELVGAHALGAGDLESPILARIDDAGKLLSRHEPRVQVCTCGRPLPCPVAATIDARRRDFVAELAGLTGDTKVLPVITARPKADAVPSSPRPARWRRLRRLTGGRPARASSMQVT